MSHSLNEIEAMAKRAARGAGLSWGLSEEAGKATRWLASHNRPATSMLADILDQFDNLPMDDQRPATLTGVWQADRGPLNPLIAGACLSDCAAMLVGGGKIKMDNVAFPLFIVPFAGWAALQLNTPVAVSWDSISVATDGHALAVTGELDHVQTRLAPQIRCATQFDSTGLQPATQRGQADPDCWARLGQYAHRTYAPATDQSRLLGAGAGLSDND